MRKADQHQGVYYAAHVRKDVSGCTTFQGEDHDDHERKKRQQAEQREYLNQQMEEKKQKHAMIKRQDELYDKQRLAVTEAVSKNHHEFVQSNKLAAQNMQSINQVMHGERKTREQLWKQNDQETDKRELAWTNATEL